MRRRSFNEAAGIHRGRRGQADQGEGGVLASMRPRVFTAEDDELQAEIEARRRLQ